MRHQIIVSSVILKRKLEENKVKMKMLSQKMRNGTVLSPLSIAHTKTAVAAVMMTRPNNLPSRKRKADEQKDKKQKSKKVVVAVKKAKASSSSSSSDDSIVELKMMRQEEKKENPLFYSTCQTRYY